ncbi:hypothetical protein ACOMHN_028738 [Nucella lapillus]
MDRSFTPHEDAPRSTPEPLQPLPSQAGYVTVVQPVNGQVSDADSREREKVIREALLISSRREMFHSAAVSKEGGEDREENSRPSSAPARTPNSVEHVPAYTAASLPRPRNTRPHVSLGEADNEMPSLEAVTMPGSRHDHTASSDGAESSSDQQESFLQHYSELSPGPGGEPRYMCHFCTFSTDALLLMRDHMTHCNEWKMSCGQCGFSTEEKAVFRRHRRQHQRTNPTSMLHCDKCPFTTPVPRRMREHYSFQHNEEFATTFPNASMLMRSSAFNSNPGLNRLAYGSDATSFYTVNVSGRGLTSYRLPQPRSTLQFEPANPSTSGCGNGGFTQPVGFPTMRNHSDRRPFPINQSGLSELTLEYLFGHSRATPPSTITSCEYPARPSNPHRPDLNNFSPLRGSSSASRDAFSRHTPASPTRNRCPLAMQDGEGVKVKTEPIDCDGVSDVSSSGVPGSFERGRGCPEQERLQPETTSTHCRSRRPLFDPASPSAMDQSKEVATSGGDVARVSQSSEAASSQLDAGCGEDGEQEDRREEGGDGESLGHHLLFSIKAETASVAVQCSGSAGLKSESALPLVTVAAAERSTEGGGGGGVERGRRLTARTVSTDSDQHSLLGGDTRCLHCGISFEDEVLFSIHLGCHSHTDPFVCNVCGKKCQNKYGFYSHIMRGHHL